MSGSPAAALVTRPGPLGPAPVREPGSPAVSGPQSAAGVFRAAINREMPPGPPALLQREISQLSFSSISGLSGERGRGRGSEGGQGSGSESLLHSRIVGEQKRLVAGA